MLSFGVISYGLAAVAFLILALLLAVSWEGRGQGIRLIVACGTNAVWAAILAYSAWVQEVSLALVALALFVRDAAWLFLLTGLLSGGARPALMSRATHVLIGSVLAAGIGLVIAQSLGMVVTVAPTAFVLGGLALSLAGLVLLEQVYRNANTAGRSAMRHLVLGLGVIFAYDMYVFSQAQLIKGLDAASWQARGLVNALVVPLIALAARGNPQWSLNLFVSRHVVFYTTSLLAVGGYLLVMAAGGYLIRYYGGTWGRVTQIIFFVGAGAVLVSLMASTSLRRQLRVFLSKHFYRNKYDYRIEWLRFIETLSSGGERADPFESGVRAIAQMVGSPGGMLYMPVEGVNALAPIAGWPEEPYSRNRFPVLPTDQDLFGFMRRRQWVVDLEEYRDSPDVYENATLPEFLDNQDWLRLVVPLMLHDECLGFLVLAGPPSPFELTYEDRDLLKTAGRHVATHLAQHEADRKLAESRQFEAYHRLTAFVMHDLKNLAAQLSLLVSNAEKHKRNPEFIDDAISTIANSTARMQRLVEQLQHREVRSLSRRVSLGDVARDACARCTVNKPAPGCASLATDAYVDADPDRLVMMVGHLIRNAQEATQESGSVRVEVTVSRNAQLDPLGASGIFPVAPAQAAEAGVTPGEGRAVPGDRARLDGDFACLTVEDSGSGMTPQFIKERLFRPFDTTKGSKGMGIGAYQVREYVRSLGGRVTVESEPGRGTRFSLWLPLRAAPEQAPQA